MHSQDKKVILVGMDALIYPLMKKFAAEGIMPNFARMASEGCSCEALPCIPAWTPTNWATVATGAYPGTTDAYLWSNHRPSDRPDAPAQWTFDSRGVTAEYIWEAAERAGKKTLCISYPGAWPARTKTGYIVSPLDRAPVSKALVPSREYATEPVRPGAMKIELQKASGWTGLADGGLEVEIGIGAEMAPSGQGWGKVINGEVQAPQTVVPGTFKSLCVKPIKINLLAVKSSGEGYDRILICQGKDASKPLAEIKVGEWSKWLFLEFPYGDGTITGSMRFRLLSLNGDGTKLRLVASMVYPTSNWTYPESLGEELLEKIGPYIEFPSVGFRSAFGGLGREVGVGEQADDLLLSLTLEELREQAMWLPRTAKYVQDKYGWDLYYQHWHYPDMLAHDLLAEIDPATPFYRGDTDAFWNVWRELYKIADMQLGAFLEMADDNTYVIMVTDHGCSSDYAGQVSPFALLKDAGLTVSDWNGIDWSKTRAFSHGLMQVEINLKGRNPNGCVDPKDYEKTQEEIINALYDWKDPETGKRPVALALKKKDAQLIGFWGPTTADVVICFNGGYSIGMPAEGKSIGPARDYADHWCKLPTDRTAVSSDLAMFMIKGPGIKAGYERDADRLGLMKLVDVVPTICHLMGFRPPAHSQGAVLWDMIE